MFTGIVENTGLITKTHRADNLLSYWVSCPKDFAKQLKLGASVSINGVCQSVTLIDGDALAFDAIQETLDKTNLDSLEVGDTVHLERSLSFGDEVGGHVLSGHVMTKAQIVHVEVGENLHVMAIECPKTIRKFLMPKGYIALDGVSLTLVDVNDEYFTVHLIPDTLKRTEFDKKKTGDWINIEVDSNTQMIVHTVENWLKSHHETLT